MKELKLVSMSVENHSQTHIDHKIDTYQTISNSVEFLNQKLKIEYLAFTRIHGNTHGKLLIFNYLHTSYQRSFDRCKIITFPNHEDIRARLHDS